ncbi:C40 family peptidase [Fulvivirgaceae bacterium BMA12]|uniref:C40 family peptidase n=1 Tax=Agaribacillus aureus TaxID=3051825 RepID=A0ABT8L506_9BACT|nr:C40 family peptidase [Fulvivirgaceae bacterium BMA12]
MLSTTLKGICRLSVIPVRAEGSDRSEMITQLLFGDHYEVLEKSQDQNWYKIKIYFDGYEGWICHKQWVEISDDFYKDLSHLNHKIAVDLNTELTYSGKKINILIGSVLPFSPQELFDMETQLQFNGKSENSGERKGYRYLEEIAFRYLNAPYLWGGKMPFGIDCSGFTQQVYRICGYNLKRDSWQQAEQGLTIDDLKDAHPGDLVFFAKENKRVYHVGILLADSKVIHASGFVRVDRLDSTGIFNEDLNRYTHKLFSIKRILKDEL